MGISAMNERDRVVPAAGTRIGRTNLLGAVSRKTHRRASAARSRRMRHSISAMTLLLCLTATSPARAEFAPVSLPIEGGQAITGFAVSEGVWLALISSGSGGELVTDAELSDDDGQSWTTIDLNGSAIPELWPKAVGVTVGPDGAFYLSTVQRFGASGQYGHVLRIAPNGTLTTEMAIPAVASGGASMSPPAFDSQGRMWVAWSSGGEATGSRQVTLARVDASGAVQESYTASIGVQRNPAGAIEFRASGTWLRFGTDAFKLVGGALTPVHDGICAIPSLEEGPLAISATGISLDGGASFINFAESWNNEYAGAIAVEGSPSLLFADGHVLSRYSAVFWAPTALTYPTGVNQIVQVDGGLVAVSDEWEGRCSQSASGSSHLAFSGGSVPPLSSTTTGLNATAAGMVDRANHFRAEADLPPLLGDPLISKAAENHSRYWTLNAPPSESEPLAYHSEMPGAPGFTGATMSERCSAVGATCNGEDMFGGAGAEAVDWWVASAYHRPLLMSPAALLVGAAQVPGGPAVMDGEQAAGVLVGPVGFPVGSYDGPLEFFGEAPDPTQACAQAEQPVSWPLGTAVTVFIPGGIIPQFTVTPVGGKPLAGCQLQNIFLPAAPLTPGTTYMVRALWQPTPEMDPQAVSWKFATIGSQPPRGRRAPTVSRLNETAKTWREGNKLAQISGSRHKRKPPVGTTFSFSLNERASVTFSFAQQAIGRKVGGKCMAKSHKNAKRKSCKRTVTAGTLFFTGHTGTNRVVFQGRISRSKKLKPGRYTAVVTAAASGERSGPKKLPFRIASG